VVPLLFYLRLVGFTVGALVYLFLLALIIGHRRPRLFERLLFFLMLSLFLLYCGGLLEMNARVQYGSPPEATRYLYLSLTALGSLFLIPLVGHTHFEYARQTRRVPLPRAYWGAVILLYLVPFVEIGALLIRSHQLNLVSPVSQFLSFQNYNLVPSLAFCSFLGAILQIGCVRRARELSERHLFQWLFSIASLLTIVLIALNALEAGPPMRTEILTTVAIVAGIFPGALVAYFALRHNFLEFGAQRNLVYALSATFLGLLYLALVRRISGWLEPILPPEATASILLFVLIFLFEPVERLIGPALHRSIRQRMDQIQRLMVEVQAEARNGDLEKLFEFTARRLREAFGLADLRISFPPPVNQKPFASPGGLGHVVHVPILQNDVEIGTIEASSTGAVLTGEVSAALQIVGEQLPAAIDLCRLIGEKLRLERELAERERFALVGQMAASISHNLRNPLSSMKTVLQVLLEKPDLPQDVRADCSLVVAEVDRLSSKLGQLLQYAKPWLRPAAGRQRVAAMAAVEQVITLLSRDAERRQVKLTLERLNDESRGAGIETSVEAQEAYVCGSEEALNDIVSNLVVNAIEALPRGGSVKVSVARREGRLIIEVADDGPGIPGDMQKKIFQPFYTTKPSGTGLGLSIVERRLAEMNGSIHWESPIHDSRGTRFIVSIPLADTGAGGAARLA
jgi:signal transduction histidine kinase